MKELDCLSRVAVWTRVRDVCEGARLFIEGSSVDTCTRCL